MESAPEKASYEDLYGIPENMTGEIIDGELHVTPRPSRSHGYAASALGTVVGAPYQFGRGGPGGWVFIVEPEVRLGENIVVPDLAGWKRERFPKEEPHNWISVPPDWVCEVLVPHTLRTDRVLKMPIYARHGVKHLWHIDPGNKTLDVYGLESGKWLVLGLFLEEDIVRAQPFEDIEISLGDLWLV